MKRISIYSEKVKAFSRLALFHIKYSLSKFLYIFSRKAPILKKLHFKSFPAVHLKKLDHWDYLLSFSSELIIFSAVLIVAGLNFYFFTLKKGGEDFSLASRYVSYHHKDGDRLYGKLASIKTTVEHSSYNIIPEAYADTTPFLENTGGEIASPEDENLVLNEDGSMVRPNPDTVSSLVAKQIKVHTVQSGESLSSIASIYNISPKTILWANNLTENLVKPGWQLMILPTDGVLVKADSNTTLPDIAFKYKCSLETIISYNGLDGADDIEEGKLIIAPGCSVPPPPVIAKPNKKPKNGILEPIGRIIGKHIFPKGYCTWYVATRMNISFGGNAKNWPANAKSAGYTVTSVPTPGSAVVTTDGPRRYGHVAYVEDVTDSCIKIKEMNYKGFNVINSRCIPRNSKTVVSFILPK